MRPRSREKACLLFEDGCSTELANLQYTLPPISDRPAKEPSSGSMIIPFFFWDDSQERAWHPDRGAKPSCNGIARAMLAFP